MSVLDEGNPLGVVEVLEDTPEYHNYLRSCGNLEEIEEMEEVFNTTSTLDKDIVSSIESKFPGLIVDNTRFDERYTLEGHQAGLESLQRRKQVAMSDMATAFVGVVDKLHKLTGKLKTTRLQGSVSQSLATLKQRASSIVMEDVKLNDAKLLIAYDKLMGEEARDAGEVKKFIQQIGTYKNPIMCLKDFPNSRYDKLFTPLLADSAADNSRVFKAFALMNEQYADELVGTIRETQHNLNNIIQSGDQGKLARFTTSLIPKGVDQVLNDIVASLEIEVSSSKPLLAQTNHIASQLSKQLRTSESSVNKKAVVVNAITHRSDTLDKGFKDINETMNTLSALKPQDAKVLQDVQQGMKLMRQSRTGKDKLTQMATPVGRQASKQYRRLMREIRNVWNLINLFSQMSVVYVSCYSVLSITLDNFAVRLLTFSNNTKGLKTATPN